MISLRVLFLFISLVLASTGITAARLVRTWTDQELLDKSDLVVIAVPSATHDTSERGPLPCDERQAVIGVRTEFSVTAVLKGDQAVKGVTLHHYRPDQMTVVNAPTFVSFEPKSARASRLYLARQADGFYAPVAGQEDPGLSIREEYAK